MFKANSEWLRSSALFCAVLVVPGDIPLMAQAPTGTAQNAAATEAAKVRPPEELDSLVAPIALYPDPLLAQVLAASTYPLEIVEAQRWFKANPSLKGEALTKAAAKQSWDPSVQALVAFPEVLKRLDEGLKWTTELGNAFLEQQGEVMDAVQRMRKKAKDGGKLDSSKEQKVEVQTIESKSVIVIEPKDPQVIYVPTYDPVVVYGAAPPAYAYPPYPYGAVAATAAVSFGVGIMMGAMWGGCCGGGGYGWGCGWGGGGNNTININNNFNNRYGYANVSGGNRTNVGSGNRNSWQHNPAHRGSVPYGNRNTAQRFGGTTRGSDGRTERFDSRGRDSASNRDVGGGNRSQAGSRDQGADRNQGQAGSGDKMGNRSLDSGNRSSDRSAFGGGSKERTQAASDRGFSSSRSSGASSSRSSGFSGGGGGGGSRSRSGGGRRR